MIVEESDNNDKSRLLFLSCRTLSGRKQEFSEDNKFILICSSHRQIICRPVMIILLVMTGHELMIRGKGGPPPFDRLFVATRSTPSQDDRPIFS